MWFKMADGKAELFWANTWNTSYLKLNSRELQNRQLTSYQIAKTPDSKFSSFYRKHQIIQKFTNISNFILGEFISWNYNELYQLRSQAKQIFMSTNWERVKSCSFSKKIICYLRR